MKRYLKIVLSLALAFVLAGSVSGVAQAHHGSHSRRAKSIRTVTYTANRNQKSGTADNAIADAAPTDNVAPVTAAAGNTATTAPAEQPEAPAQAPDPAPTYAACYANGYCTGNNTCDVNGVCQYGGICSGAPCYQNETCPWDGGCIVDGACQYGGGCYGITNQNTNSGNYGHHGGGHHGGRHHR